MKPVEIYISYYEEEDEESFEQFKDSLKSLGNRIKILNELVMDASLSEAEDLKSRIDKARLVFFLVTPAFIARKFHRGSADVDRAMYRQEFDELLVFPVMVQPTNISDLDIADFRILPQRAKPISKWSSPFNGWENVVQSVKPLVHKLSEGEAGTSEKDKVSPPKSGRKATVPVPIADGELEHILKLVHNSQLDAALEMLLNTARAKASSHLNDVILLTSRYNGLRRDYNAGIISHSSKTVSENRIAASLLELLKDMEKT